MKLVAAPPLYTSAQPHRNDLILAEQAERPAVDPMLAFIADGFLHPKTDKTTPTAPTVPATLPTLLDNNHNISGPGRLPSHSAPSAPRRLPPPPLHGPTTYRPCSSTATPASPPPPQNKPLPSCPHHPPLTHDRPNLTRQAEAIPRLMATCWECRPPLPGNDSPCHGQALHSPAV